MPPGFTPLAAAQRGSRRATWEQGWRQKRNRVPGWGGERRELGEGIRGGFQKGSLRPQGAVLPWGDAASPSKELQEGDPCPGSMLVPCPWG